MLTQREAAEYISTHWNIPMHESKLSILVTAGVGPKSSGRQGASTVYHQSDVDQWAACEVLRRIEELETEIALMRHTLAGNDY